MSSVPSCPTFAAMLIAAVWLLLGVSVQATPPSILFAQLAAQQAMVPDLCEGSNDLLPVTFSAPVLSDSPDLDPDLFRVEVAGMEVAPSCATLKPAAEAGERQTVLLLGQFSGEAGDSLPDAVKIVGDLKFMAKDGGEVSIDTGSTYRKEGLDSTSGPIVLSAAVLRITAEDAKAQADENGCATAFPDTNFAVRLVFGAGVREAPGAPPATPYALLGAAQSSEDTEVRSAARERALRMFKLRSAGKRGRRIRNEDFLGIADVDPDNVVDLCLKLSKGSHEPAQGTLTCEERPDDPDSDYVVRGPTGLPCDRQDFGITPLEG